MSMHADASVFKPRSLTASTLVLMLSKGVRKTKLLLRCKNSGAEVNLMIVHCRLKIIEKKFKLNFFI